MAQPSLAPAGSSTYSSNTLHVGDGTWNANDDTFLLPNIMGLNFDTMRYNGMGNRFRQLNGYQSITTGHGVLAAITFLAIVPAAILIASFYHRNPHLALKTHIGLQVFTVLLTTVVFVLGYFAVGPERSLTNPHHGIGLTIYLLILLQAFGGWIIQRLERKKVRYYIPVKLMLHQWLGRGIALLGFAQVPIGLTLYGSPSALFILYSLWMFGLLVLYFILVHRNHKRVALGFDHDDGDSYTTGAHTEVSEYQNHPAQDKRRRRLEEAAGAVGLGAALTALRRRSSGRKRTVGDQSDVGSTIPPSQAPTHPTASGVTEKFTESDYSSEPRRPTWRERLLGPGVALGGLGGLAAAKRVFGRGKDRDDDFSDVSGYTAPPLGGNVSSSAVNFNHMEEGRPLAPSDDHWRRVEEREAAQEAALRRGQEASRLSDDSDVSYSTQKPPPRRGRFGLPASIAALGAAGGVGAFFKRRKDRKEDARIAAERDQDHENERLYTSPGGRPRYTGDGTPRRAGRVNAPTPITERTESPERSHVGASATGSPMQRSRPNSRLSMQEPYSPSPGRRARSRPPGSSIPPPPRSRAGSMAPTAPPHTASPSNIYSSPGSRSRIRDDSLSNLHSNTNIIDHNPPISPPPAATATGSLLSPPNPPYATQGRSRSHSNSPHDSNASPVASVKVRMGNDGRHVTLRRLNEEEAAQERANRRNEVRPERSDMSNGRFRRDQTPTSRPQVSAGQTPAGSQHPSNLSLPPQQSAGVSPPSALGATSQGTAPSGTEVTDFESNRRRRRAERARAEQARAARRGTGHVEFE